MRTDDAKVGARIAGIRHATLNGTRGSGGGCMPDNRIDENHFYDIIAMLVENGYIDVIGKYADLEFDLWDLYKEVSND
jgi:hypothetical protein